MKIASFVLLSLALLGPASAWCAEGPATFEQVLADPDNVSLNLRLARAQIDSGNLKGAAATLERILIIEPSDPSVRLLYAAVLVRLDSLDEAERELDALDTFGLADVVGSEVAFFRGEIQKRRRRTHVSASAAIGFDFDDNRNSSPASGQRLIVNQTVSLKPEEGEKRDTAVLGMLGLRLSRDLGLQAGHEVFAGLSHYRVEQTAMDVIDLQAYSFQAGASLKLGWGTLTPQGNFDHIRLSEETFMRSQGGGLKLEKRFFKRLNVAGEGRLAYEEFLRTSDLPVGPERSGRQYALSVSGLYALTPALQMGLSYEYSVKEAARSYHAWQRHALGLNASWTLRKGAFVSLSLNEKYERADKADPLVGGAAADIDGFRFRGTVGSPLGLAARFLSGFLLTVSYEYDHRAANVANYSYANNKFSSLLSYRWEI